MSWTAEIDRIVEKRHLLTHPLFVAWSRGALNAEAIRGYAGQFYRHVLAFPTYLSAVHSEIPDLESRQHLLESLLQAERGEDNHPELWLRFAEGVGLRREDVRAIAPLPETAACDATFRAVASRGPASGLAALFAYSSMVPALSETAIEALGRYHGIDDPRALSFFTAHVRAGDRAAEVPRTLLDRTVPADERRMAVRAAEDALRALWTLLDGVVRSYCPEVAA